MHRFPTHRSFTNLGHELQIWVVGPYLSTKRIDQISGRVLSHALTYDPTHDLASSSVVVSRESPSPVPPEATVDHLSDFVKLSLSPCICPVLFEEAPHEIILDHVSPLYQLDELPPVALAHARNALALFNRLASPGLKQRLRLVGCFVDIVDAPNVIYSVAGALHTLPGNLPLLMFTSRFPAASQAHTTASQIPPLIPLGSVADSLKNPPLGFPWMLE